MHKTEVAAFAKKRLGLSLKKALGVRVCVCVLTHVGGECFEKRASSPVHNFVESCTVVRNCVFGKAAIIPPCAKASIRQNLEDSCASLSAHLSCQRHTSVPGLKKKTKTSTATGLATLPVLAPETADRM